MKPLYFSYSSPIYFILLMPDFMFFYIVYPLTPYCSSDIFNNFLEGPVTKDIAGLGSYLVPG